MPPALRLAALFAVLPSAAPASAPVPAPLDTPLELAALLARHDQAPDGPAKAALAAKVDAVAHQKYATVSRLYWHTDFATAQAAAREQRRPILHLRMLGRLDEDRSCANSRFFRAMLYANSEVSQLLRDKFVLYWSSERPVPKITIDFGDGRKVEGTTTGNSAHYVLDADGTVLDVLPGLYAPRAFQRELEQSLVLATKVRGASATARHEAIVAYHRAELAAASRLWSATTEQRVDPDELGSLWDAQRVTVSKAAVEMPTLRQLAPAPESFPIDRTAQWAATARVVYGYDRAKAPRVLDEQSRALVLRLHDAAPAPLRATAEARDALLARFEERVLADTAVDQLRLRPQISREIVRRAGRASFAELNGFVYASVFHTPAGDPWLGLVPRTDFTGLPGDGVVMP